MSFKAMCFATEQTITKTSPQSHLLLILASYANEQGECYPSIKTMMAKTRLSDKTVRNCLKDLVEFGLLRDTGKLSAFGAKVYQVAIGDVLFTPSKSTTPSNITGGSKSTSTPLVDLPPPPSKSTTHPPGRFTSQSISNNHKYNHKEESNAHTHPDENQNDQQQAQTQQAVGANKNYTGKSNKAKISYSPPDGLAPSDKQIEKCQKLGLIIADEWQAWIDWTQANGRGYANWSAGFSTWLRNAESFGKTNSSAKPSNSQAGNWHNQSNINPPSADDDFYREPQAGECLLTDGKIVRCFDGLTAQQTRRALRAHKQAMESASDTYRRLIREGWTVGA